MGDKGGKSALKSPLGNNGNGSMSKKGKKVQFDDSEDSLDNNIPTSNGKADKSGSKGGKGDKANGTSKTRGQALSPAERRLDQEIPQKSVCLMDCEAAEILQNIQDQMVFLSQDPDIKLPVSFDMGLTYAKRSENNVKPETVKKILESLKKYGVSDCEICLIANICTESAEEVFGLIPTLKPKMSKLKDPLEIALREIAILKKTLAGLKCST